MGKMMGRNLLSDKAGRNTKVPVMHLDGEVMGLYLRVVRRLEELDFTDSGNCGRTGLHANSRLSGNFSFFKAFRAISLQFITQIQMVSNNFPTQTIREYFWRNCPAPRLCTNFC